MTLWPSSILHPLHKFVDLWGCFFLHQPPPAKKKSAVFCRQCMRIERKLPDRKSCGFCESTCFWESKCIVHCDPQRVSGVPLRCAATRILDPSERLWRLAIPSDSSPVALRRWYAQMATRRSFCWGLEKVGTVGWDCLKARNFGVGSSVGIIANY